MQAPQTSPVPALEVAAGAEWLGLLDNALQRLPIPDREAVLLHFLEQRSFEETGHAMGITAEAARKRATRAIDRLRAYFARLGYGSAMIAIGPTLAGIREAAPLRTMRATVSATRGHSSHAVASLAQGASHLMLLEYLKVAASTAAAALVLAAAISWGFSPARSAPQAVPPATAGPNATGEVPGYSETEAAQFQTRNALRARLSSLNNLVVHYHLHTDYPAPPAGTALTLPGAASALIPSGSTDTAKTLSIRDGQVRYDRQLLKASRTTPLPAGVREFSDQTFIFTPQGVQRLFKERNGTVAVANIAVADQLPEPDLEAALGLRGRTSPQRAVVVPLLTADDIDAMVIDSDDAAHPVLLTNRAGAAQDEWVLDRSRGYAPIAYRHRIGENRDVEMRMSGFTQIGELHLPREITIESRALPRGTAATAPAGGWMWRVEHLTVDSYALHDPANGAATYTMNWPAGIAPVGNASSGEGRSAQLMEIRVGDESFQASSVAAAAPVAGGSPFVAAPRESIAWMTRHHDFSAQAQTGDIQVLFLGDQLIQGWSGAGARVWSEKIEPLRAANFGIAGDRVENVLWRVRNGELDGAPPRVVVLAVGSENAAADDRVRAMMLLPPGGAAVAGPEREDDPAAIAAGIQEVVRAIREKSPPTRILLVGLPQGAETQSARGRALAERCMRINQSLAALDNGGTVRYLELSSRLLQADGSIAAETQEAGMLKERGYRLWEEAMAPLLQEMLK
jgi:N-acetylglucosamine-6-sulfatase